jgi:hypothetical protein
MGMKPELSEPLARLLHVMTGQTPGHSVILATGLLAAVVHAAHAGENLPIQAVHMALDSSLDLIQRSCRVCTPRRGGDA